MDSGEYLNVFKFYKADIQTDRIRIQHISLQVHPVHQRRKASESGLEHAVCNENDESRRECVQQGKWYALLARRYCVSDISAFTVAI